jgi:hypothetical protein
MSCRTIVVWLILGASLFARPKRVSAAENADACADAYELTQSAQRSGRLFEARSDARLCAAKCPPRLAKDCNAWETQITAQIPSFVVRARGADGAPIAVDVLIDGAPAAFTETGSIEVEPGPHGLVLFHSGVRFDAHVDLVAGVRNQLVEVTIADAPRPIHLPLSSLEPAPAPHNRAIPVWRWLVGGLGLATLAAGGAVSISGEVLDAQFRGSGGCAPHCTQAQAEEVVQRWTIGGTLMGVGGAGLLFALLWPAPSPAEPPSGQGPAARVSLHPGWVRLEVAF